jgi:hypothetical protein
MHSVLFFSDSLNVEEALSDKKWRQERFQKTVHLIFNDARVVKL